MHVTIDHAKLTSAATKLEELASRIEAQKSRATFGTPIGLPTLGATPLGPKVQWMRDELPKLQGLAALGLLLDTEGNGHATFDVGNNVDDIKAMLGETLAAKSGEIIPLRPEEFEQFGNLFAEWTQDPDVMSSFYSTLGPEGTLRFLSTAAQDAEGYGLDIDVQQQLLDDIRSGLETATTADGFDDVAFGHGLVEQATVDPEELVGRGVYNPSGALAFLLNDGTFDRPFLETVATDLDDYERVQMDGASGLWGNRPDNGADFSQFLDGVYSGAFNMDPMIGVMSAMENDPELALDFFSDNDDPDKPGEGINSRAYYYIHERSWDLDGYDSITGVIDAATTDPDNISDPESQDAQDAALLASKFVDYLSTRDNFDRILDMTDYPTTGASENVAHIMTTYMAGVDAALAPNAPSDIDPSVYSAFSDPLHADIPNMPLFDRDSLEKISLLAMNSDDGFAQMRSGLNDYRADTLGMITDRMGDDPSAEMVQTTLHNALQSDARLEGFFVHTLQDDKIADADARDKRTAAWIKFGSEVVDLVPVPGVDKLAEGVTKDIVNAAINRGESTGKDAITEWLVHEGKDARASANDAAQSTEEQQSFVVAQLLAERGLAADPDLDVPNWDEYSGMSDGEQAAIRSRLFSVMEGVGGYFDINEYHQAYRDEFLDYFK